jgi:hypothetical protein
MAKKAAKKPPKPAEKKQTTGNCYQLAATAFLGLLGAEYWQDILGAWLEEQGIEPRNPELVHGFPFQPIHAGGERIGHAWIECHHRGKPIVIDLGTGRRIAPTLHQRSVYYSLGRIERKDCHRYKTAREVAKWIAEAGFWGPWGAVPEDAVIPGRKR